MALDVSVRQPGYVVKGKFIIVGIFNVLFTLLCLAVISTAASKIWSFQFSFTISAFLGILVGYQTNRRFVWPEGKSGFGTFLKFLTLNASISILNWILLSEAVRIFKSPILQTQAVISVIFAGISFTIMNSAIFRSKKLRA